MTTPATDAVTAAREAQEAEPQEASVEIPDMHPDAAMEMAKIAMTAVLDKAEVPIHERPEVGPGVNSWDAAGGSVEMNTTGPNPDVDLLVIRFVYIPAMIQPEMIAALLHALVSSASVAPRGSQPHQALLSQAHGHDYNDGLPDQERLQDKDVETMGGKGDTKCPECGNELNEVNGLVTGHRADCPYNLLGVPPAGAA